MWPKSSDGEKKERGKKKKEKKWAMAPFYTQGALSSIRNLLKLSHRKFLLAAKIEGLSTRDPENYQQEH